MRPACLSPKLALAVWLSAAAPAFAQEAAPAPAADAPAAAGATTSDRNAEIARIRHERGLQVCRDSADGATAYRGSVLDNEHGNVQIEIDEATDKASGAAVTGFREIRVWDEPKNWRICS
ncbi:hypothetical protein [Solimonas flava]|jgi:hypothetical protein|uniref:hypothetical protein n=1 Tax=Solimonas flava TaxID=415849 RepID=UPI0003FDF966|nr:hypothetical protein [Solimonas flava]